jgi:hypothetical protein
LDDVLELAVELVEEEVSGLRQLDSFEDHSVDGLYLEGVVGTTGSPLSPPHGFERR